MAILPNPQDLARVLIAALVHNGCRPDEGLPIQAAHHQFDNRRRVEDFVAAVMYAETSGWVILTRNGLWITLTQAGFDEA